MNQQQSMKAKFALKELLANMGYSEKVADELWK